MKRDLFEFAALIALQQSFRKLRRSIAAFCGITGGILMVLVQLGFQSALYDSAVRLHQILNGDLVLVPAEFRSLLGPPWFSYDQLIAAMAHRDVASVAPLQMALVPLRNIDNRSRESILTIGIDLDAPAINLAAINANIVDLRIPGNVLFDVKSQPFYGDVPAHIRRDGRAIIELAYDGDLLQPTVTAVGTHALGGTIVFPGTLLASAHTLTSLSRLPVDRLNMGIIGLKPGANPEQVRNDLAAMFPPELRVFTKAGFVAHEKTYWKTETPIGFLFDFGAIIGFFISGIYTYQVLYQIVEENLPQYALLKSMGYPNEFFVVLVITTAAILAATALPAAVVLGAVVYALCAKATMLDVELTGLRVAAVSAMMIGLSVASALLASRRLSRIEPASLL